MHLLVNMSIHRQCLVIGISFAALVSAWVLAAASDQSAGTGEGRTVVIEELEWTVSTNGENIKWPEAVAYCAEYELAGHDDWRLPSLDELERLHDPETADGIRSPFAIEDCCLWSGESLIDRPAPDGEEIAGAPDMYHWGFMFDGGLHYYAVHIFDDGRALCVREAG